MTSLQLYVVVCVMFSNEEQRVILYDVENDARSENPVNKQNTFNTFLFAKLPKM